LFFILTLAPISTRRRANSRCLLKAAKCSAVQCCAPKTMVNSACGSLAKAVRSVGDKAVAREGGVHRSSLNQRRQCWVHFSGDNGVAREVSFLHAPADGGVACARVWRGGRRGRRHIGIRCVDVDAHGHELVGDTQLSVLRCGMEDGPATLRKEVGVEDGCQAMGASAREGKWRPSVDEECDVR